MSQLLVDLVVLCLLLLVVFSILALVLFLVLLILFLILRLVLGVEGFLLLVLLQRCGEPRRLWRHRIMSLASCPSIR